MNTNDKLMDIDKEHSGKLFDRIYRKYDLLNHLLSFGLDLIWRRKAARMLKRDASSLEDPSVLDLAAGTGDMTIAIKKVLPQAEITCMDISLNMLKLAKQKTAKRGMSKITFREGNAAVLPLENETYDAATVAFGIRNFPHLQKSLSELHRILANHGRLYVLEFGWPKNPFFGMLYKVFSLTIIPFLGWIIAGDQAAYKYLHQTIRTFPYGETIVPVFKSAGFEDVEYQKFAGGIVYLYRCSKKS